MNILIAGASGLIGKQLVHALQAEHTITVLGRDSQSLKRYFSQPINLLTWDTLSTQDANTFDAIINLCGETIAAFRWNALIKKRLIDSRVNTTTQLIDWVIKHNAKPHFISANAIGIYGVQDSHDNRALDEDTPINFEQPCDFLSEIGIRWQQALQPAIDFGMNVTSARFGVVLKQGEGFLKKLTPSFYMGLGSILGDGAQMISWVHITDVVNALVFLLKNPALTGPFNITSPNPITQLEFARQLASVMNRPLFLKLPAIVVQALFGEMGEYLLLKGQRVIPTRLIKAGFTFRYPEIGSALHKEYD